MLLQEGMQTFDQNSDSVYFLVTALCRNIAKQHGLQQHAPVVKLKAVAYEILLKKSCSPQRSPAFDYDKPAQAAYDVHIFAAKLKASGKPYEMEKCKHLDDLMEAVWKEPYFAEGYGQGVLQVLLALKQNISNVQPVSIASDVELLVPGPFTLFANRQHNAHYPRINALNLSQSPRHFCGKREAITNDNPYLPKLLFDGETNKSALALIRPSTYCSPKSDYTVTDLTRRQCGSQLRVNVAKFRFFTGNNELTLAKKTNSSTDFLPQLALPSTSGQREEPSILSWDWEHIGGFGLVRRRPFAGDTNVLLDLQYVHKAAQGFTFEARILTQAQFLQDIKNLTVGIQSDTFQHNAFIIFGMQPHVTIDGVLPETLKYYALDFLECGTCYKRLQMLFMNCEFKRKFDGFIFRALSSAIDEYLLTLRQFVFAHDDTYLVAFYTRMSGIMHQLTTLSCTLAIHPSVDTSVKPPWGAQFLGYLYREIERHTNKDYMMLLVFILKRCCHVYFKHLQKWIFYGLLDDPSHELFIGFVDHYHKRTKYFYDKAYFVQGESVPGFFHTYEDEMLLCGKYTMLLKACKPNHLLFSLPCPEISVCLSFDEIIRLEGQCAAYSARARQLCGEPTSIRNVFEARIMRRRDSSQRACQRSRETLELWKAEQQRLAILTVEMKRQRHGELEDQLREAKQRKVAERREATRYELQLLQEAEQLEERRMLGENLNLRQRIEYYQELNDLVPANANARGNSSERLSQRQSSQMQRMPKALEERRLARPETPVSIATTEFHSCYGDLESLNVANEEDTASEYLECISEEFMLEFEETESELQALCATNANNNNNNRSESGTDEGALVVAKITTESTEATTGNRAIPMPLKRSVSDLINSNQLPELVKRVMGKRSQQVIGTADQTATTSKTAALAVAPPLTEAQRNKQRVLSHDSSALGFEPTAVSMVMAGTTAGTMAETTVGTTAGTTAETMEGTMAGTMAGTVAGTMQNTFKSLPDINLNTAPDDELSDLQRNRNRMMNYDVFSALNSDELAERAHLQLDLTTERSRNRRKVLACEYGIFADESTALMTTVTVDVATPMEAKAPAPTATTPMSTTSDTPLTECSAAPQTFDDRAPQSDLANGNPSTLRLDVVLANAPTMQSEASAAIETAATATTPPELALNPAGLMVPLGFDFDDMEGRELAAIEAPPQLNGPQEEECGALRPIEPDYSCPYQRCMELLESNFQCAPRNPYLRLNMPQIGAGGEREPQTTESLDTKGISVITLTACLQKSVVVPMRAHLELVNNEVMRMFLDDLHLVDHLRSLRHYFLLMDGEFGAIICDGIIGQLECGVKPQTLFNYQMLHSILDTALGSSLTGSAKNAGNLSFIVSDQPDRFDLNQPDVLQNLSLSYHVAWPLNLVLNVETLEKYANIFRYLMKVRRISWTLERTYQLLKEAVKKHGKRMLKSPQFLHVQQIRHKLYHFVHALQNHITATALQASWKTFKDDLLQAKSIEDIYRKHTNYVKRILFLCMLNRSSVNFYNAIESIFKISLRFYNNLISREFKIRSGEKHYTHSRYEMLAIDEAEFDKFIKYTIYMGNKIVNRGYQKEIGEFICLINFNQYYMKEDDVSMQSMEDDSDRK